MNNNVRFVTVISNDGITIFHKTYIKDDIDEYLFSGFSSAMVAFSKELNDELHIIKMKNQTLFYEEIDDGILILSINDKPPIQSTQEKVNSLKQTESLNLMLDGSKIGIMQQTNEEFERDIENIFEIDKMTISSDGKDQEEEPEETKTVSSDEDLILEALEELKYLE